MSEGLKKGGSMEEKLYRGKKNGLAVKFLMLIYSTSRLRYYLS